MRLFNDVVKQLIIKTKTSNYGKRGYANNTPIVAYSQLINHKTKLFIWLSGKASKPVELFFASHIIASGFTIEFSVRRRSTTDSSKFPRFDTSCKVSQGFRNHLTLYVLDKFDKQHLSSSN